MATETIVKVTCDICNGEINQIHKNNPHPLTVVFTTEQTEGRSIRPYLTTVKLDWCHNCEEKMIAGNMLFGSGAMGYNQYWFKNGE